MADNKEQVTYVRYGFNGNDLFANMGMLNRCKTDESVQKYAQLCKDVLQQSYPNAIIEVISPDLTDGVPPNSMETYVEAWNNFVELPDSDEINNVTELCERIYQQFNDWLVFRNIIPVSQSKELVQVPSSVVRWACVNNLIGWAEKGMGFWEVDLGELQQSAFHLVSNGGDFTDKREKRRLHYCYIEDSQNLSIQEIPDGYGLFIVSKKGFETSFFSAEHSLIAITWKVNEVEARVEHFTDVMKWSNPRWAYDAYVEALVSQSKEYNLTCEPQIFDRDGSDEIDGVTFQLICKISQDITLQILIDQILKPILSMIQKAELHLQGGPLWNEIHEKDESRFCEDILEPLLQKMGFLSVRYIHGIDEFGKDFIFADDSLPFSERRYYGLQAKAGNVGGGANSLIDTILAQIEDAFAMPYTAEPRKSESEIYISLLIIAISGKFSPNAIKKIRQKMPAHLIGSVYFWDKPKIRSLILKFWNKEEPL